ncbi:hypothetical protein [Neobacillus drentensis]|uniref:hypothetical protein n=1 Tax=Neobacillus drentensis TaxID=220684 RepID=UPI003001385B
MMKVELGPIQALFNWSAPVAMLSASAFGHSNLWTKLQLEQARPISCFAAGFS